MMLLHGLWISQVFPKNICRIVGTVKKCLNQLEFFGEIIPALSFFGRLWRVLLLHPWACYRDGDQDSSTHWPLGNIQMGKQFLCRNIFCQAMVHWKIKSKITDMWCLYNNSWRFKEREREREYVQQHIL